MTAGSAARGRWARSHATSGALRGALERDAGAPRSVTTRGRAASPRTHLAITHADPGA